MHQEKVAGALSRLGFEPVLISGCLAYRTLADDGTPGYRFLSRPRDIGPELWGHILEELPDLRRELLRAEVLEVMRGMASEVGQPMPWASGPRPDFAREFLKSSEVGCLAPFDGSPSLARAVIPLALARQRRPKTRAPLVVVVAPRHHWPAVRATLASLFAGHVHMDGPGHGQPSPDALAVVYDAPPEDEESRSRFWTEARGDSRRPAPLPVVLADPLAWSAWTDWMRSSRRSKGVLPPMWAYNVDPEAGPLARADALALWGGALALRDYAGDSALAVPMPEASPMDKGIPRHVASYSRAVVAWVNSHPEAVAPSGSSPRMAVPEAVPPD